MKFNQIYQNVKQKNGVQLLTNTIFGALHGYYMRLCSANTKALVSKYEIYLYKFYAIAYAIHS
jgi:hypothetical protein